MANLCNICLVKNMKLMTNFGSCYRGNFFPETIFQQHLWFKIVHYFIHHKKSLHNQENRSFELYKCLCKCVFFGLLFENIVGNKSWFASVIYLKRLWNIFQKRMWHTIAPFSHKTYDFLQNKFPWWFLMEKLRDLLNGTKACFLKSIIRECIHLSWEVISLIKKKIAYFSKLFTKKNVILKEQIVPFSFTSWNISRHYFHEKHNVMFHDFFMNR